jgi:DNA-3-methyladenine glycosylase
MSRLLPQSFYARDALTVAEELLGQHIHAGEVVLRITEVEAYRHPGDTASHCRMGRTPRNAPMWGPPGHAYVYLCYGIHNLLNFVTNREGEGAAVLIRSCEPVRGLDTVLARRRGPNAPVLLTGPGKVTAALGVDLTFTGRALFVPGPLEVHEGEAPSRIARGPRVGVGYAELEDQRAPWRLAIADSPWVSQRATLVPDGERAPRKLSRAARAGGRSARPARG